MANAHHSHDASHGSYKSYAIGFILSVILTVIPFGLVMYPSLPKDMTILIVVAFAVIQVVVHLFYFLHLDSSREQRWNVSAFLFTGPGYRAAGRSVPVDHVQHPHQHDGEVR